MKKTKILKLALATATLEICQNLYNEGGASKVYDYCNKIKLQCDHCTQCEANTPTITTFVSSCCAVCGGTKNIEIISTKDELVNKVLEQIKKDVKDGDVTAIDELLHFLPSKYLKGYLPES